MGAEALGQVGFILESLSHQLGKFKLASVTLEAAKALPSAANVRLLEVLRENVFRAEEVVASLVRRENALHETDPPNAAGKVMFPVRDATRALCCGIQLHA